MGIEKFIKSICVQTAVYWGNPTPNGYGGFTFDEPIEIPCRWKELIRQVEDKGVLETGELFVSQAEVLVPIDLQYGAYLFLGTLEDVLNAVSDSSLINNPVGIDGAYKILKWRKTSMIRSTKEFVRKAFL